MSSSWLYVASQMPCAHCVIGNAWASKAKSSKVRAAEKQLNDASNKAKKLATKAKAERAAATVAKKTADAAQEKIASEAKAISAIDAKQLALEKALNSRK